MRHAVTPLDCWRLSVTMAAIGVEAQMVIAMRMMGLWGIWTLAPGERMRMVAEKQAALGEAGIEMAQAMARGLSPAAVAGAAMAPIRRRTRSNMRRLARRAPVPI